MSERTSMGTDLDVRSLAARLIAIAAENIPPEPDWHALLTDHDAIAADNRALKEALVAVRQFKRADGSELLPDWMQRDIDAALAHGDGR